MKETSMNATRQGKQQPVHVPFPFKDDNYKCLSTGKSTGGNIWGQDIPKNKKFKGETYERSHDR